MLWTIRWTTVLCAVAAAGSADAAPEPAMVLKSLRSSMVRERIEAGVALLSIDKLDASAIPVLIEAMGDDYLDVRQGAAAALHRMGAAAVPALSKALSDPSYHRRWNAARVLGRMGPAAEKAIDALGRAISDEAMEVRYEAANSVVQTGQSKRVAGQFVAALSDPSEMVRQVASEGLSKSGPEVVGELARVLREPNVEAQQAAARAVSMIGPAAAEATPALLELLRQEIETMRREAAKIENAGIRDSFLRHGMSDRPALRAMGRMGPAAVPPMIELLRTREDVACRWACRVLGDLGDDGSAAVPDLLKILRESADAGERERVAMTLGLVGAGSPEAAAGLRDGLCEKDKAPPRSAAGALARLKASAQLAEVLKHGTPAARKLAAEALGGMGSSAVGALPALREVARDSDADVKAAVEKAIKAIQEKPEEPE